jgi:general secretion pathway protein H
MIKHILSGARSDRGLTLLEVLVALGIMAMALAVALPFAPKSGTTIEVDTTAREIAAGLRGARAAAIASNRFVEFHVDVANGIFGYDRASRPHNANGINLALFTTEERRRGDASGSIRFFPDGSSTGGGVSVSYGKRRLVVMVDWLSGGVSVVRDTALAAS